MMSIELNEFSHDFTKALSKFEQDGGKYVLLGKYPQLPQAYDGTDIDILVTDEALAKKVFQQRGWALQKRMDLPSTHAFAFSKQTSEWIVVELVEISNFGSTSIGEYILRHREKNSFDLFRASKIGLFLLMVIKYMYFGYFRGEHQIRKLTEAYKELTDEEITIAEKNIRESKFSNSWFARVCRFLDSDNTVLTDDIQPHIEAQKIKKYRNRPVYNGKIRLNGVLRNPNIMIRIIRSQMWMKTESLPCVAVIGNDGAGKTTFIRTLLDSKVYKTDPVHISFKSTEPILPIYKQLRPHLRSLTRTSWNRYKPDDPGLMHSIRFIIESVPFWLREIGDYVDRYVKYAIGRMWADAGLGIVIFERYATDRLRGEYPGPRWSLFPLEAYLPFPDRFLYFDVDPADSLQRKPNDGHELTTMIEKRQNYIDLTDQLSGVETIPHDADVETAYMQASAFLHELVVQMQSEDIERARWNQR